MKKIIARLAFAHASLGTRTQLFSAFAAVLVLTTAVGACGLVGLQRVHADSRELSHKWLPGVHKLAAVRTSALEARAFEIKHSRTSDKSYHAEYEAMIAEAGKVLTVALAGHGKLVTSEEEALLAQKLAKDWDAYRAAQQRVITLGREGKQQDAADISDGLASTAADDLLGTIDKLWGFSFDGAMRASERSEATNKLAISAVASLVAAALLIGFGVAWGFSRSLMRRLGDLGRWL